MGDRPRTLKETLAEAKDHSELMLDLAYAALVWNDEEIGREVLDLEARLSRLVHEMREICLRASRSPADAAGLASLLQIISAIETLGNQAVDVAKIVLRSIGIPSRIRSALRNAEEVVELVRVREGSEMDGKCVEEAETAAHGIRLLAIRRGSEWSFDPGEDEPVHAGDLVVVRAIEEALPALRAQGGVQAERDAEEDDHLDGLARATDALVEMKNLSELAIALAYAAVLSADRAVAAEVTRLEDRLDEMREEVETWALVTAHESGPRSSLRGLIHLAVAAETIVDAAQAMVWPLEEHEELHPVVADALGEAEDLVFRVELDPDSSAGGSSLAELELQERTGATVIAIQRDRRWDYRPSGRTSLAAGDVLLVSGPSETADAVAELFGAALGS